jgi:pimeloyl-ACP methyl ester carboxylesterase
MGRWLGRMALALCGVALAAVLAGLWLWRDLPATTVDARYAHPASRWVEIDGVRMHYVDEGTGPAVLLLHAHYFNLRMWEPWAEELRGSHRVVRLDLTSHGLTRPDPTGDYSVERGLELLEQFTAAVGLERFALAGASLGGTHAIRYAVRHPEQVERLILLNPGALEGQQQSARMNSPLAKPMIHAVRYITPRALAELIVSSGFADRGRVPPALVDEVHDMWRMEGQRAAEIARILQYSAGDIEQQIGRVGVPVLLMWGEDNPIAHFEQAGRMRELLRAAPSVQLISYPGVGHMATYEAPRETARDARAYLAAPPGQLTGST